MSREWFNSCLNTENGVKESLRTMCLEAINATVSDPNCKGCFIANTTLEMIPGDAEIKKALAQHRIDIETLFSNYLAAGVANGEIPKDKDFNSIACLLYTLITGIRVVGKVHPNQKSLMTSVDTVLSLLD